MKQSNKWILGTTAAVLLATISYEIIAQRSVTVSPPIASAAGVTINVTTVNSSVNPNMLDMLKVLSQTPSNISWPDNIQSKGDRKTKSVTIQNNHTANVVYGYSTGWVRSVCNYLFINIAGTVTVTAAPLFGATLRVK